jgi:cell division protein FtsI/penicillin-binding protein 2
MGKGLHSKSEICFNGGFRPITAADLRGTTGNTCASMKTAFSRSYNVPFARWSNAFLSRSELAAEAHAFGFQRPSALGLSKSAHGNLEIPLDKLKRAGTAAGFGDIHLSPLHGALMAAAVGNGGVARKPVWTADKATTEVRLFPSSRSRALRQMMVATVTSGTARKTFKEQGKPALGEHGAGGKTGTLGHRGRDLSWFVGFAPAENPRYAVGAYVANRPTWRIRASYVGREALRSALLKTSPYRPKSSSLASR